MTALEIRHQAEQMTDEALRRIREVGELRIDADNEVDRARMEAQLRRGLTDSYEQFLRDLGPNRIERRRSW